MVDFSSLDAFITGTITHFHNYAKNVQTVHLGKLYTTALTALNGINYYVVECAAKPALAKAPEWVSVNRVVNSIQSHKGLTILAAGVITFIFIVIMLHPEGDASKSTDPDAPSGSPETSDNEEGSDIESAEDGGKEPSAEESDHEDDPDAVNNKFLPLLSGGAGSSTASGTSTANDITGNGMGGASMASASSPGGPGAHFTIMPHSEGDTSKPTDTGSPGRTLPASDEEEGSDVENAEGDITVQIPPPSSGASEKKRRGLDSDC